MLRAADHLFVDGSKIAAVLKTLPHRSPPPDTRTRPSSKRIALWPVHVVETRRTLAQLAALSDYELRDVGLTRQDLADLTARPLDEDPTPHLNRARIGRARQRNGGDVGSNVSDIPSTNGNRYVGSDIVGFFDIPNLLT